MVTTTEIEVETVYPDHDDNEDEPQVHYGRGGGTSPSSGQQAQEGDSPEEVVNVDHGQGNTRNEEGQGLYPQGEPLSSTSTSTYSFI